RRSGYCRRPRPNRVTEVKAVMPSRRRAVGNITAFCMVSAMLAMLPRGSSPQPAPGAIRPPLSPRDPSYTTAARPDPGARTIAGDERIVWRNITTTTATELQFHLYWNAWKDAKSTFMRERALAGFGAGASHAASDWSKIEVSSVKLVAPSAADLTASQH